VSVRGAPVEGDAAGFCCPQSGPAVKPRSNNNALPAIEILEDNRTSPCNRNQYTF
jgi:hypothetical protein